MQILLGTVVNNNLFVTKENEQVIFYVSSPNNRRILKDKELVKLLNGQHIEFKDQQTRGLIENYLEKKGLLSSPEADLASMLSIPNDSFSPGATAAPIPPSPLSDNQDFLVNLPGAAPLEEIAYSAMEEEIPAKPFMSAGDNIKKGIPWSIISLWICVILFVIWLVFLIMFGFIGGNKIPVIKNLYNTPGITIQPEEIETTATAQ